MTVFLKFKQDANGGYVFKMGMDTMVSRHIRGPRTQDCHKLDAPGDGEVTLNFSVMETISRIDYMSSNAITYPQHLRQAVLAPYEAATTPCTFHAI